MSMARDGLLPKRFASIHPKFKTPAFSTVVTGIFVALPTIFLNSQLVTDLSALGTLFAFVLVSGGILALNKADKAHGATANPGFRVPYLNGKFVVVTFWAIYSYFMFRHALPANHDLTIDWTWEKFPYLVFYVVFIGMAAVTFIKNWSLIPVLGVITNLYLIAGIGHLNWLRFGVWCLVGLAVYFVYGYRKSRLVTGAQS
jgi:amino acid transporter